MSENEKQPKNSGFASNDLLFGVLSCLPRCWDCKSVLWPWQHRGIDDQSHRDCHRARVREYREQLRASGDTEMLTFLASEERQIEDCYNG